MWISDFAIRRPIITIVSMLALVVFGGFALVNLDTDEFPEVNPPIVSVAIPYPGASPDVVEREVVEPMEEAIAAISGIDRINSQSLDGFGIIIAEFDFGKDIQQATQDIRDQISQIRGDLPLEMEEPILTRFDPNDFPIVTLSLTSERLNSAQLTRLADPGITRQLRGINGVAEVEVVGGQERELTVQIDPQALQAAGVSVGQVVQALQMQNLAVPVGRLAGDLDERTIRLRGRLQTPEDFERLVVGQVGGRVIRLGEVARVADGTEEQRTLAQSNGREAVGIQITKAQGNSTTAVADEVLARVKKLQKTLPPGVTFQVVRNAGDRVERSVTEVEHTLFEGAILTVLVVFLFLNSWRSTVITGLALPVSVLASFVAVWAFGFTLNTMSLLGLSLAIGILIDDAIVVRENIVRHVEMGKDHYTAAREGTSEIGLAVAATTFSIVVVFLPIAFMDGLAGQWFKPLALTIASSVLVSLFVSFSLDPMLSAYWPDPHLQEHEKSWITRKLDGFNRWFDRQAEGYKRVIGWALDHRVAMVLVALGSFVGAIALPQSGVTGFLVVMAVLALAVAASVWLRPGALVVLTLALSTVAAVAATAGALYSSAEGAFSGGGAAFVFEPMRALPLVVVALLLAVLAWRLARTRSHGLAQFALVVLALPLMAAASSAAKVLPPLKTVGGSFFPEQDVSEFNIKVETPPGSNLAYTSLKAEEAAAIARSFEGVVDYTFTTIGGQSSAVDEATVYVRLVPKAERDVGQKALEAQVRAQLARIGGATAGISAGGFGGDKQIKIQLQGPDIDVLNQLAERVQTEVAQVPGAVDVGLSTKGQKPELDVVLDRGLAGSLGVTAGQVAQALRPAFAGIDVGDWIDPQNQTRDVTVRLAPEARTRVTDLQSLPLTVAGPQGPVTVPLGQVARVEEGLGPAQINRLQRERVINVEANTQGRPLSEVLDGIDERLEQVPVPPGYSITQGGEAEDQAEVFGQIFGALGLAVLLMYFVLVVQFGSFLDPLAIMLSLPLSLIGVMLALLVTGSTLNIMSMIGVILLMGLVAKNAILLIDFAKWSHEAGMPLREALIEAGRTRLRPILMTTFALVAGMLPIAIGAGEGADFRAPLGRAVIGGVITSTFLTLLVIPTIYEILAEIREWIFRRTIHRGRRPDGGGERERSHAPAHRPLREPEPVSGD